MLDRAINGRAFRACVEQVFSKLKPLLGAAASHTKTKLWNTLGGILDRFPPSKCVNYLAHSGCI